MKKIIIILIAIILIITMVSVFNSKTETNNSAFTFDNPVERIVEVEVVEDPSIEKAIDIMNDFIVMSIVLICLSIYLFKGARI